MILMSPFQLRVLHVGPFLQVPLWHPFLPGQLLTTGLHLDTELSTTTPGHGKFHVLMQCCVPR